MAVILMYHMVRESDEGDSRFCCRPRRFRLQMAYLKWFGYRVLSFERMVGALKEGRELPRKAVVLTFDDGFRDNYENALPVLQKYGFPAIVFVVSDLVGQSNEWMTRNGLPQRELASWDDLRVMAKSGVEIGSHTAAHAALDTVDTETMANELRISMEEIERNLGGPVRFFAYPYGRLNEAARAAVMKAGYEAACSTRSGFNNIHTDPFILHRIEVYGSDSLWRFALKIVWGTNDSSLLLVGRYYLSRVKERLQRWTSAWI